MKKIGNWWAPDNTIITANMIEEETFTCLPPLDKAYTYVKRFNLAIDVGTWIGDSTTSISKKFNTVIAFEANKEVYECCSVNLKDRSITNVDLRNIGLSNTAGTKTFYNGKSHFSGWISDKYPDDTVKTVSNILQIETAPLDDFNFIDVDFIKIDVDSHEGFLLQGAQTFLKNNSPVILIENKERIHAERQPENRPNVNELLNSLGYIMVEKVAKADFIYIKQLQ
jgi:FkbM family methyltransferase